MFDRNAFEIDKKQFAKKQYADKDLQKRALDFVTHSDKYNYAYQWSWLGMPIIQLPQDILAMQEIIWDTKPDIIIETGVAWGGSIVYYASILQLLGKGKIIGIDVVLPEKNRVEILKYPFSNRIELFENSSTDEVLYENIKSQIKPGNSVMVILDSNHTHDHVLKELRMWGSVVTKGQYLIVSDTLVEDIPVQTHRPRPWSPGNNPKTALVAYLKETTRFKPCTYFNEKQLLTCHPDGYLVCVE